MTSPRESRDKGFDIVARLYQSEGCAAFLGQKEIAEDCREAAETIKRLRLKLKSSLILGQEACGIAAELMRIE